MITPKYQVGIFALALLLCLPAISATPSVAGVPNFQQVNETIFRGGQPAPEAWAGLAGLGVKTVIDLRRPDEHSTVDEAKAVEAAGMKYVNIPMKGVVAPGKGQIEQIMAILHAGGKVFVHCKRGADRTGAVIACYRIEHHGWQSKQALSEAKALGMSWTQMGLKGYVKSFKVDKPACDTMPALSLDTGQF